MELAVRSCGVPSVFFLPPEIQSQQRSAYVPLRVTCPQCNAKLAVGSENAGKRLRCPKCQTIVEVPHGDEDDVVPPTQETTHWKVVVGTKKGGPFGKAKLRQLVDGEKLPGEPRHQSRVAVEFRPEQHHLASSRFAHPADSNNCCGSVDGVTTER